MKVYINELNIGFIKNFEKGCKLANGEFISFCDQDDYWYPDKVKKMIDAIDNYPLIYCDSIISDENLNSTEAKISDIVNFKSRDNCLELAVFCRIYAHAMLCRKSFLAETYPFLDVIPPDWWLPYLSTIHGGMKYFPEALVLYRQHQSNVSGVIGGKRKRSTSEKRGEKNRLEKIKIRTRIQAFYNACPGTMINEKKVLGSLVKTYSNFSLVNNIKRFIIFLNYRNVFLDVKKYSSLHRLLFCFKMFIKIK
jgi:glycosyltransferase involved in cell wall biosynthesis